MPRCRIEEQLNATSVKSEPKTDRPLRVLIVEDARSADALLLLALLKGGF